MNIASTLETKGALYLKRITIASTYTIVSNDYIVSVNNLALNVTISLPNPVLFPNRIIVIKRYNSTSTGTVTVNVVTGTALLESATGALVLSANLGTVIATRRLEVISNGVFWENVGLW